VTYATREDVIVRMDRSVTAAEHDRIDALLFDVEGELNARYSADIDTLIADYPDLLLTAEARAVARLMVTPVGPLREAQLDDMSEGFYRSSGDLLVASDTAALDRIAGRAGGGIISVQLVSSVSDAPEDDDE